MLRARDLHCRAAGGGDATPAKDALGDKVIASQWLAKHPAGDRNLVQGLKSDATYLIGEHTRLIRSERNGLIRDGWRERVLSSHAITRGG